jgi:hypothetical protein
MIYLTIYLELCFLCMIASLLVVLGIFYLYMAIWSSFFFCSPSLPLPLRLHWTSISSVLYMYILQLGKHGSIIVRSDATTKPCLCVYDILPATWADFLICQ